MKLINCSKPNININLFPFSSPQTLGVVGGGANLLFPGDGRRYGDGLESKCEEEGALGVGESSDLVIPICCCSKFQSSSLTQRNRAA